MADELSEQPIPYNPDTPLTPNEVGWIEQVKFKVLQSLIFKGGLPVFRTTPTYKGEKGEIILVDDGISSQKVCAYLNGAWRCQDLSGATTGFSSRVRAYRGSSHSVSDSVVEKIPIDTAEFDGRSEFSSGNERITVSATGIYLFTASLAFSSGGTGVRRLSLQKNGSGTDLSRVSLGANANVQVLRLTDILSLTAGDYVEMFGLQDSGAPLAIDENSYITFLAMHRLS